MHLHREFDDTTSDRKTAAPPSDPLVIRLCHCRTPSLDHLDRVTPPYSRPASPLQPLDLPRDSVGNEVTSSHLQHAPISPHHQSSSHSLFGLDHERGLGTNPRGGPFVVETLIDRSLQTPKEGPSPRPQSPELLSSNRAFSNQHPLATTFTSSSEEEPLEQPFQSRSSPPASSFDISRQDKGSISPHFSEAVSPPLSQFRFPLHPKKLNGALGRAGASLRRHSNHSLPQFFSEAFQHRGIRPVGVLESQRYMNLEG